MGVAPASFPPPVTEGEFVAAPQASGDDVIEVGVLIVGGGPAGLSCAIRMGQLLEQSPELMDALGEVPIAVVDKGRTFGAHQLSGLVLNPGPIRELLPDTSLESLGSFGEVRRESVYLMTRRRALRIPTPPPFHNKGNHVFSLSQLTRKLADQAEELGVFPLPETTADRLLVEDGKVVGVRTGDKGRGREGEQLGNFEPGAEIRAKLTVLAEGTQGHLSMALMDHFQLNPESEQIWSLGVKEVWKVTRPLDRVIHTLGWPLRPQKRYQESGGSFVYPMGDDHVCVGFVVGLDYRDATVSVHDLLQQFKTHPRVRSILEGGERVSWGAKTIPEGGWWALPTSLAVPGAVLAGDCAGMVNVPKLKGVHYAMRAGMLAAESIVGAMGEGADLAGAQLDTYHRAVLDSEIGRDLYRVRNMRQTFEKGFFLGGALASMMDITRGRFPGGRWRTHADRRQEMFIGDRSYPDADGSLIYDKLGSVFASGNRTRDDQPNHIRIQQNVPREVALTWVNMCPAAVYEIDEGTAEGETVRVNMSPSNCIHCGAITAKGGRLTPPEGGSGPEYTDM